MNLRLGIDYGGTATKLVLGEPRAGQEPVAVDTHLVPTPRGEDGLEELAREAARFVGDRRVEAGGLSVPGLIGAGGRIAACANLPWLVDELPGERIAAHLGVPVTPVNDGYAAALAEARLGAGRHSADTFVVALGTGIAGKHVVDGHVRTGAHGASGEIGHIVCDPDGHPCSCGQRGCLETLIGGDHLARRYAAAQATVPPAASRAPDASSPRTRADSGRTGAGRDDSRRADVPLTARDVTRGAEEGDPAALRVCTDAAEGLATVLLGVVATLDPGLIVIGGGVAQAWDVLIAPAIATLRSRATFHTVPEVRPAALGRWGGAWGAALAAA